MTLQQGFPQLQSPLVNAQGSITSPWLRLLVTLWNRTGGADSSGAGTAVGFKPGDLKPQAHLTIASGWLLCDGTAIDRTSYAALFAAIGTTWGAGNGATTFNLPNAINRFPMGGGSSYPVGSYGGATTKNISVGNLPPHSHTITDAGHTHEFTGTPHTHAVLDPGHTHTSEVPASNVTTGTDPGGEVPGSTGSAVTGVQVDFATADGTVELAPTGIVIDDTGGGSALDVLNPYFGAYWVIKI